jgi:hypothetical protein
MKEENKIGNYEIHEFATEINRINGSLNPLNSRGGGLFCPTFTSFDDDEDEEEDDDFDDDDFDDDDDDEFFEDEDEDEEFDDMDDLERVVRNRMN